MAFMYRVLGGDRKEYGPVSVEEVRRWLAEGRLNGQSLVKPDGEADWRVLSSFSEITQTEMPGGPPPVIGAVPFSSLESGVLSRQPELEIGRCLARSGALLRDNFGLLAGATALVWLCSLTEFVPRLGGLLSLVYRIFAGALYG